MLFAYIDRGFREVLDLAALIKVWMAKGIHLHFVDLNADLRTPAGMLTANLMVSVAQHQSDQLSQRNKAICQRMKRLNRPCNGQKRYGFRVSGDGPWEPDPQERAIVAEIQRMREQEGATFRHIISCKPSSGKRWVIPPRRVDFPKNGLWPRHLLDSPGGEPT